MIPVLIGCLVVKFKTSFSKMPGKGGHRPQNLTKIMKIKNLNHDHRFSINELS